MWGWLYRRAVALRELGERVKIRALVNLGLWLREKTASIKNKTL
jgi:hypothetical protein